MREVALWRAVIVQAIQDVVSGSAKYQARIDQHYARAWLLSSDGFMEVCEMADLCPSATRQLVRRLIADPTGFRDRMKKGNGGRTEESHSYQAQVMQRARRRRLWAEQIPV